MLEGLLFPHVTGGRTCAKWFRCAHERLVVVVVLPPFIDAHENSGASGALATGCVLTMRTRGERRSAVLGRELLGGRARIGGASGSGAAAVDAPPPTIAVGDVAR